MIFVIFIAEIINALVTPMCALVTPIKISEDIGLVWLDAHTLKVSCRAALLELRVQHGVPVI